MRKARKALLGVTATALLVAVALALPASSAIAAANVSGSPVASEAKKKKKKCKKKGKKGKKCKKKKGGVYFEGRYAGTYAENNVNLFFNVVGGRVYTGPFDGFYIDATCYNSNPEYTGAQVTSDTSVIEPVQATIAPNGSFSGSGVYVPGFGQRIPWRISGHISGRSITGASLTVGPYLDYYGDPCSGITHFTAEWYGSYVL